MTAVVPYLCARDARAALDYYSKAFNATEDSRIEMEDGRLGHAEFSIGDAVFYLSDEYLEMGVASPQTLGGTPVALHLTIPNVDAVFEQAVAAGATALRPPADQDYGLRSAVVVDPFGHRWFLASPLAQ
ncbi:MAG TPA: VOC family protein [Acidimicrobiales bacterium]|jgi:PhnB protein|nr:VOC family protein [Acidimicrobiales bacterium]